MAAVVMANNNTSLKLVDFPQVPDISQDHGNLITLKKLGFALVQVKVSPISSLRGRLLSAIALPAGHRVLCVLRNEEPVHDLECAFLRSGDALFILTSDAEATRRFFMF